MSEADQNVVQVDIADGVATVMLNRPSALNAINAAMHHGLRGALAAVESDTSVRVVVLRGAGRAFSSGGDMKAVAAGEDVGDPATVGLAIWNLSKPVVAAVHGYCLGQAYELAAACDLTVAAQSSRFGELEINHGYGPPLLITPFVLGLKHAKEFLLLGELVDADRALSLGLVNRVVPDDRLDAEVKIITDRLAALDPVRVAKNKRLVNETYEIGGFLQLARPSRDE